MTVRRRIGAAMPVPCAHARCALRKGPMGVRGGWEGPIPPGMGPSQRHVADGVPMRAHWGMTHPVGNARIAPRHGPSEPQLCHGQALLVAWARQGARHLGLWGRGPAATGASKQTPLCLNQGMYQTGWATKRVVWGHPMGVMERRFMGDNYHVARLGWRCLVGLRRCDEGGEAPMMTRSRSRADDGAIARLRKRVRWR